MSSFWTELFKLGGIKLKFNSAYHLQTDEQTEVVNCCLKNIYDVHDRSETQTVT